MNEKNCKALFPPSAPDAAPSGGPESPVSPRRSVARMAEQERHYRTLFEISPSSIILVDAQGIILDVNPAFHTIFGYARDEAIGMSIERIAQSDSPPEIKNNIRRILSGENLHHVVKNVRRNGSECFLDLNSARIALPDGSYGVLIVAADITERKRAEEILQRHSLVYNSMQEAVLIFDRDGVIIDVNPAAESILGRAREDLLGRPAAILNPPELAQKITGEIMKALTTGEEWRGEIPLLAKSGEIRTAATVISCLRDQDGNWIGSVGINRDITVRKKLEAELIKAQKLESLGVLAGGLAHDFNNLLMGILGNISLARILPDDPSQRGVLLRDAEKACLRAKTLTGRLLTFARGGVPVKQAVALTPLLEESVRLALQGSSVGCEFSFCPELWPVEADPGQIGQVVTNLALNAEEAMPDGGTLLVRADNFAIGSGSDPVLPPGRYVKVSVIDQGGGIPDENLGKIFDPFFSTKAQKAGLGLAVSYSIIKNHRGRIAVESEPGRGSAFCFYLPAAEEGRVAAQGPERYPAAGQGRILIIDDEELVVQAVGRMLERLGYSSESAREGAEGVERYAKERESGRPFAAVILDLTIPDGMGGKEAIAKLRAIDPSVRAIAASGYSDDPILADCRAYGFRGALSKPFTLQTLSRSLSRVLCRE